MLTCPDAFLDKINKMVYKFVWNNKPNKVKRNTIIADYEDGGLKMLNIKSFVDQKTFRRP